MGNTWITDMRDFLDEGGRLPDLSPRVLNRVLFHGSIIAWVTIRLAFAMERTNVPCIRSPGPGRRRCLGEIEAGIDVERDAIAWRCPLCGENGYLSGWLGTPWDRSLDAEDDDPDEEPPGGA